MDHLYVKPRTPHLKGKVERSHRPNRDEIYHRLAYRDTLDLEKRLSAWEKRDHFDWPHGADKAKTPYEALREKRYWPPTVYGMRNIKRRAERMSSRHAENVPGWGVHLFGPRPYFRLTSALVFTVLFLARIMSAEVLNVDSGFDTPMGSDGQVADATFFSSNHWEDVSAPGSPSPVLLRNASVYYGAQALRLQADGSAADPRAQALVRRRDGG